MAGIPHWLDSPGAWDTLVLAGKSWPGIAKVTIKGGCDLDVKKGKGSHGAQITYTGYSPREVTIALRIWTRDQWTLLQDLIATIEPSPSKRKLVPYDITHPVTTFRKVKSIAIKDIDGPDEGSPKGSRELKISAIEFFPPTKKNGTSTPKAAEVERVKQVNLIYTPSRPSHTEFPPDEKPDYEPSVREFVPF